MEGDGATSTAVPILVPTPSSPPHASDFSPVGSPEIVDLHLEEEAEDDVPLPQPSHASTLTDDLRDKIIKQVEYYFSDENLPTDKFLMKHVTKNAEGFVPIAIIASFRKMKKLTQDRSLIVAALQQSALLVVSLNGKKVRRLHPLPVSEVKDPKMCTVLVENLPEDHSAENIQRIFSVAGNIINICIRDSNAARGPKNCTVAEKLLSGKLHALVEYDTTEAAEKAVAMLNDQQDWRYGMRVKLLKPASKHVQKKKGWRETDAEKGGNVQTSDPAADGNHQSSEHQDDAHDGELQDADHASKDKNGHKGRHRGWGRGQRYRGTSGQGHGAVSSSHVSELSKPPPGPRMPDGSRGFTMGRGRPPAPVQN